MNLFIKELRTQRTSLIIWSVAIAAMLGASMVKYDTLTTSGIDIDQVLSGFPAMIRAVFGMNGLDISTIEGYYGVNALFVYVMLAVHAGLLGAQLIAKEEAEKTSEFLHVKPRGRSWIVTQKLLAGLVAVATLAVVTVAVSFVSVQKFASPSEIGDTLLLFGAGYVLVQIMFYTVGLAAAGILRNPQMANKLIAAVVFVAYLLYVLINVQPSLDWAKPLTPFMYFDARDVLADHRLSLVYVLSALGVSLLALVATYVGYNSRDLKT